MVTSFRQAYEASEKAFMDGAAKFAHVKQQGIKKVMEKGSRRRENATYSWYAQKWNANRRYCKVYKFTY
ncbi:hypothetical protein A9756_08145 [Bacillus cereus]|nr:hypothetical protein A9756_08145 [Bacillus cereus]